MKEVLTRLAAYDDFQIIVFRDEVILKEPIEKVGHIRTAPSVLHGTRPFVLNHI